jgi:hypothetical protein
MPLVGCSTVHYTIRIRGTPFSSSYYYLRFNFFSSPLLSYSRSPLPFSSLTPVRRMEETIHRPRDPNTLSNYTAWLSRHVTVNLAIIFDEKRVEGNVIHALQSRTNAKSREILLDTSFVEVSQVKLDGKTAKWELLPRFEPYGSALKVDLNHGVALDETIELDVGCRSILSVTVWTINDKPRFLSPLPRIARLFNG